MTHIHWGVRQNNLEKLRDKGEVNKREIHECDGRVHDPDIFVCLLWIEKTRANTTLWKDIHFIKKVRKMNFISFRDTWKEMKRKGHSFFNSGCEMKINEIIFH